MKLKHYLVFLWLALLVLGAACSSGDDDDDSGTDDDVSDDDAGDDDAGDDDLIDDDITDDDATDDDAVDDDSADDDSADDDAVDDDSADDDTTVEWTDVAYFYHSDNTVALGYETFLEGLGYTVDLHEIAELDTKAEVGYYRVFMIDNNAGSDDWTTARRQKIYDSERPIIGLGAGIAVLEEAGTYLSYGNAWMVADDTFRPNNDYLGHVMWHMPNDLGFDTNDPVQVYSGGSADVYEMLQTGNPAGVEFLGYFTPKAPEPHFSIATEN